MLVELLAALALIAALVAATVAVMIFVRMRRGSDVSIARQLDDLESRTDQIGRSLESIALVQTQRSVELQQIVDDRLTRLTAQNSKEASRRLETDSIARQEMQATLGERLQQMETKLSGFDASLNKGLEQLRTTNATELEKIRLEVADRLQKRLRDSLAENSAKIEELKTSTATHQDSLKQSMRAELEKVRSNNEAQLEKMRATVDEKLQGTLEKRLGESFKQVSERLEQVQRGLGEMQTLATDVGGLKRVLSNVKSRGTWGEVQLGRQLQDILTLGQFEENVAIKPGSGERVEFAVRLPGRDPDAVVFLPIDSKFPQEPYERLLEAQESGDASAITSATKELESALRLQAKNISTKYIAPPQSTDFAIMYLPTEGLFAEAVRVPGLASSLQRDLRVVITGPTTLMSLLNSLQMGFRTLAIEKRSSEVWRVLAAAKDEFNKYGMVWEKLQKQLKTAQNTVDQAARRTRVIGTKLRDVESLDGQIEDDPELELELESAEEAD